MKLCNSKNARISKVQVRPWICRIVSYEVGVKKYCFHKKNGLQASPSLPPSPSPSLLSHSLTHTLLSLLPFVRLCSKDLTNQNSCHSYQVTFLLLSLCLGGTPAEKGLMTLCIFIGGREGRAKIVEAKLLSLKEKRRNHVKFQAIIRNNKVSLKRFTWWNTN